MRLPARVVTVVCLIVAAPLAAQQVTAQCLTGDDRIEDACQKATDVFEFMAPQLALVVGGGNATLGTAGTLGGFPRYSVGLRATAIQGSFPQVDQRAPRAGAAVSSDFPVTRSLFGLPALDAALGLYEGMALRGVRAGALDLLVSASYLPNYQSGDRRLKVETPGSGTALGVGARIGLVGESRANPAVVFTYLRRDLPTTNLIGITSNDTLAVNALDIRTAAWRAVASKTLGRVTAAVGLGQDSYKSGGTLFLSLLEPPDCFPDRCRAERVYRFAGKARRAHVFMDASARLGFVTVAGEVGTVRGGKIPTFNTFDGESAADTRYYASLGVRAGI